MAAELGETTDPRELIPGNAGTLEDIARSLRKHTGTFEDVGKGLGGLRIDGWTGKASDAFWERFSGEERNWLRASDAMSGAASAISTYSGTLSWAQQKAAEAISLWESGDESQAQEILKAARQLVRDEGDSAAKKLAEQSGSSSRTPAWLSKASEIAKSANAKTSLAEHEYEKKPWERKRKFGDAKNQAEESAEDPASKSKKPSWGFKLAEVSGEANLWEAGAKGETQLGDMKLAGAADVKTLGVEGSAGLSVKDGTLEAGASGSAYLAKVHAEGSAEYGIAAAKAEGTAFAGAEASATTSVGKAGVHAGAEAFAGAKASGSATADVGGVGAGVSGEAWAGAGASASADLGMKDGKFTVGGEVGVGLGVGGKVGFDVTVDPGKVVDTVGSAADAVGDGLSGAADAVGDGLSSLNPFG